jgi:hypothetical protein
MSNLTLKSQNPLQKRQVVVPFVKMLNEIEIVGLGFCWGASVGVLTVRACADNDRYSDSYVALFSKVALPCSPTCLVEGLALFGGDGDEVAGNNGDSSWARNKSTWLIVCLHQKMSPTTKLQAQWKKMAKSAIHQCQRK